MNASLWSAILVAFLDSLGIGLIYPLFSVMLFDPSCCMLAADTSSATRGLWLGGLLSAMPLAQFFSAPIWGTISDRRGRRAPLQWSLVIAAVGYAVALAGVSWANLWILVLSRMILGIAAGNIAIILATISDVSTPETKVKNYGLFSMGLGAGYTLGPLLGGVATEWGGYHASFGVSLLAILANLFFVWKAFRETHHQPVHKRLSWSIGFHNLKKALSYKGIRLIFLCSFLHHFSWSYFFEFVPVFLMQHYFFSALDLGYFYGFVGACYALSAGLLIRPLIKRFRPLLLFFSGNVLTALTILLILVIPSPLWIWPLLLVMAYVIALVMPNAITFISNQAGPQLQGEALGVLTSVNTFALVLSPLCSGSLVGKIPTLPIWVGGVIMLATGLFGFIVLRKALLSREDA